MKAHYIIYIMALSLLAFGSTAQDIQLTQFNASPLYLNPAMAGATITSRLVANYRNQWSAIMGGMSTSMFSFDHHIYGKNIGWGVQAFDDTQGRIGPRTTGMSISGSYGLQLNKGWAARAGMQATFGTRSIDYGKLLFVDQFDNNGPTGSPTQEILGKERVFYPSIAAGGLIYSSKMWVGVSASHLNRPQMTFYTDTQGRLPMKMSVQMGAKFRLHPGWSYANGSTRERSISPVVQYRSQGKFDQLDLGVYFTNDPLIIGFWYRGIPLKTYKPGYNNHESLALLVGFAVNSQLTAGYSYDYTISTFGGRTGGSHEISIVYQWAMGAQAKKIKKAMDRGERLTLPCPKL